MMLSKVFPAVCLLALAASVLIRILTPAEADATTTDHVAAYNTGSQWPDDMISLCLEDHTHGFPIEEAASEYADFVEMWTSPDCLEEAYTVEIVTTNDPEWMQAGYSKGEFNDVGERTSARITLNLAHAYKQDPRKWRILLVHELGHAVGLDHTNEYDSVMQPYGEMYSFDGLTDTDRSQLAEIYP